LPDVGITATIYRKLKLKVNLSIAVVLATAALSPFLGTIPGLHGDEAWVGLRAREILSGAKPLLGMNDYTGPMHQYLVSVLFWFFRFKVEVLRSITALSWIACVPLYYFVVRRLFDRTTGLISVWILVTMPFFTSYGRIATENFALNPVLCLLAISLLIYSKDLSPKRSTIASVFSGVFLGLGVWNHIIFLPIPVALLLISLFRVRRRIFKFPPLYFVSLGTIVALLPRLLFQLSQSGIGTPGSFLQGSRSRLSVWPKLFFELIHGDLLFWRFAGEIVFPTPPVAPILFLITIVILLGNQFIRKDRFYDSEALLLSFGACVFLFTLLISPANSDRYFLMMLLFTPAFIALFFRRLLRLNRWRWLSHVLIALFLSLQMGRLSINYFWSQIKSGGQTSYFFLGGQYETSNHFMRTDKLYQKLIEMGAKHIVAEFFIALPLQFYDLENQYFYSVTSIEHVQSISSITSAPLDLTVVTYSGGLRRTSSLDYPNFKSVHNDSQFTLLQRQ
jgi:4-amino-4-deoxy-L-arabinose transferase-like glycosyltransferase